MKKKIVILLAMLAAGISSAAAQKHDNGFAYKGGEQLKYIISYRAKIIKETDMGEVTIGVANDKVDGAPTLKVDAYATVIRGFRWFYKLDDYYTSWMSLETGLPVKAAARLREGSWRFESDFIYDWDEMKARNSWRNVKWDGRAEKALDITENTMDGVSLFYYLRSTDIGSYKAGEARTIHLMSEDTVKTIQYKFYGREAIDVKGIGEVKTLKFSCQLASSHGSFEDGSDMFFWISDDPNHIPVYLESPLRVGSVRVRLISCKGLKYPDQSVLKGKIK